MAAILSNTIWNPDWQKYLDFEWFSIQMVGTIAIAQHFENWTIWSPVIEYFWILNG